jgi:hypothetical protein
VTAGPARNRVTPRGDIIAAGREGPAVVAGEHLAIWDEKAYAYQRRLPRPAAGSASVLTPPSTVVVLRTGYPVQIDVSAR